MRRSTLFLPIFAIAGLAQQPAANKSPTFRVGTQQVLLDFVVRDKHQKIVKDLTPNDIHILEDGAEQKVLSFTYREGELSGAKAADATAAPRRKTSSAYNPLRELNIVTIVYENMSIEGRRQAAGVVKDFLKNEIVSDTYVGMFALGYHLGMLQGYTNDPKLLQAAADAMLTKGFQEIGKDTKQKLAALQELTYAPATRGPSGALDPTSFHAMHPGSAEERGPQEDSAVAAAQKAMFALEYRMLNQAMGSFTMDELQSLIRQQATLPGRKTVLYLSEGLQVPLGMPERLRSVISAANRANVAFYTVDCTGLATVGAQRVASAVQAAQGGEYPAGHYNQSLNLQELAEGTGGIAMANSNDLRGPLRRAMEEVRSHYEITYRPTSENYDGHFRKIEVRVDRAGVKVQSRQGYYALPMFNGQGLTPYEMAAMNALSQSPLPKALPLQAAALRFRAGPESSELLMAFQIPTKALKVEPGGAPNTFKLAPAFMSLVKDSTGEVVDKVSREIPFQAPADKLAGFRSGNTFLTLPLELKPGRYTIESAVIDQIGITATATRSVLVVPTGADFGLSDVLVVKELQPQSGENTGDPLTFKGQKVVPALDGTVHYGQGSLGLYFVAYAPANSTPQLRLQVAKDGRTIGALAPDVTAELKNGEPAPYLITIPMEKLSQGQYEVSVAIVNGGKEIARTVAVAIE